MGISRMTLPKLHGRSPIKSLGVGFVLALSVSTPTVADEAWYPFPIEVWDPPFDMASPRNDASYVALEKASQKWRICVSIPHLKDAYWLAVNYGVTDEARRLGVQMDLYEAGGYGNLKTQLEQIAECVAGGAQGVIISAISLDGLNELVADLAARNIPVVDLVNGMSSDKLSAKSLVSFQDMGFRAGAYVANRHAKDGRRIRVAWFPGPEGAGWVAAGDRGFRAAFEGKNVEVVATRHGDTGVEAQGKLIEAVLDEGIEIDFIVGTSVTAEAAVKILRKRKLADRIKVMSYYYSPGVHRAIKRGKIIGAPSDLQAIQGRIAMDQIVRILEGKSYRKHVGPKIQVIDRSNINAFDTTTTLAPKGFRATFSVN